MPNFNFFKITHARIEWKKSMGMLKRKWCAYFLVWVWMNEISCHQSLIPSSTSSSSSSSNSFKRRACCSSLFFLCHNLKRKTLNAMTATTPSNTIITLTPAELLEAWFTSLFSLLESLLARPSRTKKFHKPLIKTIREEGGTSSASL